MAISPSTPDLAAALAERLAVTSFELRLHPLGPEVFALNVAYPLEDARQVLAGWRDAVAGAPDELSTAGLIWSLPVAEELPAPLRDRPYVGVAGKALYLDALPDAAIETTVDWSERRPSDDTLVIIRHCGGAIARVGAGDTAFGDRSGEWMLSIDSTWDDPADDGANVAYTRAFWDAAAPFSTGQTYFNFPGLFEEGEAAVRASYGANHDRLARIKAAYDPDNRFRPGQNIRPSA